MDLKLCGFVLLLTANFALRKMLSRVLTPKPIGPLTVGEKSPSRLAFKLSHSTKLVQLIQSFILLG